MAKTKSDSTQDSNAIGVASGDLFADLRESYPPRLIQLRRLYDQAKEAYEKASDHEDDSGEPIPWGVRREFYQRERELREEEAYAASANGGELSRMAPKGGTTT